MLFPRTVMIIDADRAAVARGLAALQASGYCAVGFIDPSKALAEFRKNARQYALIISDMRMPRMSGFELARRIYEIKHDMPIVFMTAFEIAMPEFLRLFPSCKVAELVTKPVSGAQLVKIARRYVGITEQH